MLVVLNEVRGPGISQGAGQGYSLGTEVSGIGTDLCPMGKALGIGTNLRFFSLARCLPLNSLHLARKN